MAQASSPTERGVGRKILRVVVNDYRKKKLCMHELIAALTACMHTTSTRSSQPKYQHRKKETYEVPTIAKELLEIHGYWEEG